MNFNFSFLGFLLAVLLTGCGLNDDNVGTFDGEQFEVDRQLIRDYLATNNLTATEDANGLFYIITKEGTGDAPSPGSNVMVDYKGYFLDGEIFDSTATGDSVFVSLQNVILGWQIGLQYLKVGGSGTLLLPSAFAYGSQGTSRIDPNTVIAFDIDLHGLQPEIERKLFVDYINENGLSATEDSSGIFYIITEPGEGEHPTSTSDVEVSYRGYFLNGGDFDSTPDGTTASFNLQEVIAGWQIAIPFLKKGGKGTFFIPSALGYGERGQGPIAPNTPLVFDVELVSFQ